MFLGLRMTKGISVQEFRGRFGKEIEEIYGKVLKKYEAMGFLEESGGFWRFYAKGNTCKQSHSVRFSSGLKG